jgi:hypothetical protein
MCGKDRLQPWTALSRNPFGCVCSQPDPLTHSGANYLPNALFRGAMDVDSYSHVEVERNGTTNYSDSNLTPVE